jgi:hypothetical protein
MAREGHTSDLDEMILVLRYNASHYRHTPAQHAVHTKNYGTSWMGCELLAIEPGGVCRIKIANGDESVLPAHDVRLTLA